MQTLRSFRLPLALLACAAFADPVWAQDLNQRQSETVPEVQVYLRLSEHLRLFGAASVTQSLTEGKTDGDIGAYLDITAITPITHARLVDADWSRNHYVWFRVGYAVGGIHEGLNLRRGYSDQRVVGEISGRYPTSPTFWMVLRLRTDLRTLSGERSNRYRVRLAFEKEYTVLGRAVVPYVNAEVFYDTRFDAWNRQVYQVGVEIELTQRFRIEPFTRFNTTRPVSPLSWIGWAWS